MENKMNIIPKDKFSNDLLFIYHSGGFQPPLLYIRVNNKNHKLRKAKQHNQSLKKERVFVWRFHGQVNYMKNECA